MVERFTGDAFCELVIENPLPPLISKVNCQMEDFGITVKSKVVAINAQNLFKMDLICL
jgi:hypothetical protein